MGRKKQNKANIFKNPNHVVALYDHIPTESDVFHDTEPDYIAPHDTVQLTVKKGEVFEVVGALDWWLYVKSKTLGESGYVPSVLMTPVRLEKLTNDDHKVLSRGGDVPSYALDAKVDLRYFPDAVAEKDVAHKKREICPEENANIFSRMTFWWLTGYVDADLSIQDKCADFCRCTVLVPSISSINWGTEVVVKVAENIPYSATFGSHMCQILRYTILKLIDSQHTDI